MLTPIGYVLLTFRTMIKLIHGDCLEKMAEIEDGSVDMVLTDPPYGTTACKWDSIIPLEPMWEQLGRITKDNGAICLFGSEPFSSALRTSNIKMFKYDWIWHKNRGSGFVTAKKMPMKYHEIISVFYKKQVTYNPIFEEYSDTTKKRFSKNPRLNNDVARKEKKRNSLNKIVPTETSYNLKRGKYPSSVQFEKIVHTANSNRLHPTQKPVALMEYLIKTYTNEGETVLDFTMGSGTTGVACKNLGRSFIGIEKDAEYYQLASDRIYSHNHPDSGA